MNEEFEKTISRDLSVLFSEIAHEYFNYEFRKQFDWGYSEVIFEGKDGLVTFYRDKEEHTQGMINFIISQIENNKEWMEEQSEKEIQYVGELQNWIEEIKKKPFNEYKNDELAEILKIFSRKSVLIGPIFTFIQWFPINMERHPLEEDYKKSIKTAIDCRSRVESIMPLLDSFSREIAQEICKRIAFSTSLNKC